MTTAIIDRPRTATTTTSLGAPGPTSTAPARPWSALRQATRQYERHVLAWYALGRPHDARLAREAVEAIRREVAQSG